MRRFRRLSIAFDVWVFFMGEVFTGIACEPFNLAANKERRMYSVGRALLPIQL